MDDCMRGLVKNAGSGFLSELLQSVKNHVDQYKEEHAGEDTFTMASNILVPGILVKLGHPILAMLVALLEKYTGFSPGTILENAWASISSAVKSGSITPQGVKDAADAAAKAATGTPPTDIQQVKDSEIRAFRIVALGIPVGISKYAAGSAIATSLLARIVYWVILAVLGALGILVVGEIFNKMTGHQDTKPSASGLPTLTPSTQAPEAHLSTQTLLKPSPGYTDEHITGSWIEPTPSTDIGNTIVRWATNIYPDLQGHEDLIRSSAKFSQIVSEIQKYNTATNPNYTFIPPFMTSRKSVVDYFIDEIAQNFANLPKPAQPKVEP